MSTYGVLKSRIADELLRSDLTSQIASGILRAIEFYADKRMQFNEQTRTVSTVAENQYVTLPTGLRTEDSIFATVGGYTYELCKREFDQLEYWHGASQSRGQPLDYAIRGTEARIYPEPNAAYVLTVTGIYDEDALEEDADTNGWCLGVAQDLIVARVKYLMARDILYDEEVMRNALIAERESMERLRAETYMRTSDGKVSASW
jgi:hypothetical protein